MRREVSKVVAGQDLSVVESEEAMDSIMSGKATDAQIAGYITALRMKGETIPEITGAARVMRDKAAPITTEQDLLVDVCGTGGDSLDTFNISTATSFVVAGAGIPVAKHGNRSVSSKSGSADVLEKLGVNLDLDPKQVGDCIDQIGIGFLYAPLFHEAMKHAIGPRKELSVRTIFNMLGPLTNPAGAKVQLLGVYDPQLTEPIAHVLKNLGVEAAFVVHGLEGLDELSTVGKTKVSHLQDGQVETYTIKPQDLGLEEATPEELQGGTPQENAEILRQILSGTEGKKQDIVLLNAAAALVAANKADDLEAGIEVAREVIASGAALKKLNQLIKVSNKY
jgi:anthranilate phosphoribosyltransferase